MTKAETNTLLLTITAAWEAADHAWQAELVAQFGKKARDIRYTEQGHGEPASNLRALYVAADCTRQAYHALKQSDLVSD